MADPATNDRRRVSGGAAALEWFTRREALVSARNDPRVLSGKQRELFERARGAFVAAERVAPGEGATVPLEDVGDDAARALLALTILRDAVTWALATDAAATPVSLAAMLDSADPVTIEKAAGGAEALTRVRRALLDDDSLARSTRPAADVAGDLAATRTFARALIDGLDRRAHAVSRVRTERWVRVVSGLALLLLVVFGTNTYLASRRPDLVPHARWTTSSTDLGWGASGIGTSGARGGADVFFHTRDQEAPWVEFDLGHSVAISRVLIANRADCCQDRATPLVIEMSIDRRTWTEVARRDDAFVTWDKTFFFRPRARFVRLRVPRRTVFHLSRVEIH